MGKCQVSVHEYKKSGAGVELFQEKYLPDLKIDKQGVSTKVDMFNFREVYTAVENEMKIKLKELNGPKKAGEEERYIIKNAPEPFKDDAKRPPVDFYIKDTKENFYPWTWHVEAHETRR